MKNIFLAVVWLSSLSFAYQNGYTREQVISDFNKGDTAKYHNDHLQELDFATLQKKGILQDEALLTNNSVTATLLTNLKNKSANIYSYYKCPPVDGNYTAGVWDIDFRSGEIKCAVAKVRDLYNPVGYFIVKFPESLDYFKKNETAAEDALEGEIATSDSIFGQLYTEKNEIANSVTQYDGEQYLNIPDLLLSAILTDIDIIDVPQTKASNHLVLKDGFNSSVLSEDGSVNNNNKYISARAATLVDVYSKLSDLSIEYLMYLAVFFGVWGLGGFLAPILLDKIGDKTNQNEPKFNWIMGIVAGSMLFFPTSDGNIQGDGYEYATMHTNYQRFEKTGYYLFMNWADESAKAIIDSELDSIIDRSGISSSDTLIDAYAYQKLYRDLATFYQNMGEECTDIYDIDQMQRYSKDKTRNFPTSENYTYAMSYVLGEAPIYYSPVTTDGAVKSYPSGTPAMDGSYYPSYLVSACGKAEANKQMALQKAEEFKAKLDMAGYKDPDKLNEKVDVVKGLIKFQYELYRDYGLLAVLGLPVTIMQTESLGTMLDNSNKATEELSEQVTNGKLEEAEHALFSSLPYLWLPGAGETYRASKDELGGLANTALGWIPFIGGGLAKVAGSTAALAASVAVGKTVLVMSPMISIVLIGLLRFVIIYIKIFSFHFISIFILPVMFAKQNIQAIAAFTMKILATMLELPIFVLSIWLAITANSIMHSIGDAFGKKVILGMLEQNTAQHAINQSWAWADKLKIYTYDGVMQIGIAVFSILIIYKIIVSIHTSLFEVIEVKTGEKIDEIASAVQAESGAWGAKI